MNTYMTEVTSQGDKEFFNEGTEKIKKIIKGRYCAHPNSASYEHRMKVFPESLRVD